MSENFTNEAMGNNLNEPQTQTNGVNPNEPRIVQTDNGMQNGQNKCPKCGATDISPNPKNGTLRCNFCRHEFALEKTEGWENDISKLQGEIIGSGAQNIEQDYQNIITLKCSSCGAEVVIDMQEATQARCHWCRNTLSINEQVPNGVVPDVVLPFNMPKEEAKSRIEGFVNKRKFFANPTFKKEFTTENVMGVYLPYMIVDVNAHSSFKGQGEIETRRYTRGSKENQRTYYDADLYDIEREFDITIEGLTVESSSDKLNRNAKNKTNNIINSIMPFDTENAVKWNANYLKGFNSEKRDTNIDELRNLVGAQSKDIARFAANESLVQYNRGVRWDYEQFGVKGTQWKTAYLPVWLYSYMEKKGGSNLLHYVAVNARTKETMGSVPIYMPKLIGVSILVEIGSWFGKIFIDRMIESDYTWLILSSGFIFFGAMYSRYRNKSARHYHEKETKKHVFNFRAFDRLNKRLTGLSNSSMHGANNRRING